MEDKLDYRNSVLYKMAWLYYVDNLTQLEIAKKFHISRPTVIKMLEEAHEKKIVSFRFSTFARDRMELERKLIKKYSLKDVFVVPSSSEENNSDGLVQAGAMYLDDFLQDGTILGVGYGNTVNNVIQNLTKVSNKKFSMVSMTGGVNPYLSQINRGILKLKFSLIPAPLIVNSVDTANAILEEDVVKSIFEVVDHTQTIITGIGGMNLEATSLKTNLIKQVEFDDLKSKNAVGDILMHFIDKDGNAVDSDIEKRIISTPLEKLHRKTDVIAIASGKMKVEAIKACVDKKYVNILITDDLTGQMLLKE